MNRESAQRLMNSADGKVLTDYLISKIKELDTCETVLTNPVEIAIEIKARGKAVNTLSDILDGLLVGKEKEFEFIDKKEFAVDV